MDALPLDSVIVGDCVEAMNALPEASVDLIFADPPYNLQLKQELWRPDQSRVDAVDDDWDKIGGFAEYDAFSEAWLTACRRVLKRDSSIWVIGTYHNIHRLGRILQDLGYWILNDVVWIKANPMPNFRGVRLTNAHETLIWAAREAKSRYVFNHHAAKHYNGSKQLRSDWTLPLCTGSERLRLHGRRLHSTQKPEALLERVLTISSRPGDIVLDPFFGTGTTGAVAKRLNRRWIGIEQDALYADAARKRIALVTPDVLSGDVLIEDERRRATVRLPFAVLIQRGLLQPGQRLYFRRDLSKAAVVEADGRLRCGNLHESIHRVGSALSNGAPCNGWQHWYYETEDGSLRPIDDLRQQVRNNGGTGGPAVPGSTGEGPGPGGG